MQPSQLSTSVRPPVPAGPSAVAPDRSLHAVLLLLSAAVLILSVVLRVGGEHEVVIPWINLPLPGVCTSRKWLHIDCPGCGLTRSFVSIGHGDFRAAWRFNPAGPLGFLVVAVQLPYRLVQLRRIQRQRLELQWAWVGHLLAGAFVTLLIGQWVTRFLD